jgi:hypothetical protein
MPRITQASMLARSGTRGSIADTNDGSFRSTPAFGGGATRDRLVSGHFETLDSNNCAPVSCHTPPMQVAVNGTSIGSATHDN